MRPLVWSHGMLMGCCMPGNPGGSTARCHPHCWYLARYQEQHLHTGAGAIRTVCSVREADAGRTDHLRQPSDSSICLPIWN